MQLPASISVGSGIDWESVPSGHGVYSLSTGTGRPRLGQTRVLRRRLRRMEGILARGGESHGAVLRYSPTGSDFESRWILYHLARESHPSGYTQLLRLRPPYYLKAHLTNAFPRTFVTQRLTAARALYFGPFARRSAAERFESEFLDFFGIRRCSENLNPSPNHPGCVYGEMGQCLRPCQQVVGEGEYRAEMARLLEALRTQGASLQSDLANARDSASAELEFETAARLHQKLEKLDATMKLAEEPARDIDALRAVIFQPSATEGHLEIWIVDRGVLHQLPQFAIKIETPAPMDGRLREHITRSVEPTSATVQDRADHLALLARWWFSSWRQGEMILTNGWDALPLRRLVNAASRVYKANEATSP